MKDYEKEVIETRATDTTVSRASSVRYVLAMVLLAACAFSLVVRARSGGDYSKAGPPVPLAGTPEQPAAAPISQATQPAVIIGGLGVTLTRQGFQPGRITRPPGRFVLAVVNKTGLSSLSLSLDSPLGVVVRSTQLPKEEPRWSDVHDLSPGRYILREANHPGWVCEIVVN